MAPPEPIESGDCGLYREKLLLLRDGALGGADRDTTMVHLEACPRCGDSYGDLVRFEEGLEKIVSGREEVSPDLEKRFEDRFRKACESWEREKAGRLSAPPIRRLPPGIPRRFLLLASAAALLIAGSIVFLRRPEEGAFKLFSMEALDGTRGRKAGSWKSGERFVLKVSVSKPLYLHLVCYDSNRQVDFYFPLYEAGTDTWSYLGYEDNRLPANTEVSIPSSRYPQVLAIDGPPGGREYLFAFATDRETPVAELKRLREELRSEAEKGARSGLAPERVAESLGALLRARYPAVEVIAYTIE
jgi:hypothetical protein